MVKIEKVSLFWTPRSQEQLIDYIEKLNGSEKALAYLIMGITWNLCSYLTNEDETHKED